MRIQNKLILNNNLLKYLNKFFMKLLSKMVKVIFLLRKLKITIYYFLRTFINCSIVELPSANISGVKII
jgi:hypothetical protein